MIRFFLIATCLLSTPVFGEVKQAVEITKTLYQNFALQARTLANDASENCTSASLKPIYHNAFDAWIAASVIQFGPIDDIGGPLNIAFWPDKKGFTAKTLKRLITDNDPAIRNAAQFAEVSIAAKGFFALEYLLFEPNFNDYSRDDTACALVQAITKDIVEKADHMDMSWQTGFAQVVLTAGEAGNMVFLTKKEAAQSYLTSTISALEFIEVARLARPLGALGRPRPKRAEAWRSGRPIRNIKISLETIERLVIALADGQAPIAEEELSNALDFISTFEDKSLQSISQTATRFKAESLLQMVRSIKEATTEELSHHLGVATGFNALDGD